VPFERNARFTGRESELSQLEGMLFAEDRTTKIAITGLGGVGKTNILIELVHQTREKHKYCSIIWLPATNIESLEQAYMDIAQQLGILGWEKDKADVKRLVQKHLSKESAGQWLLVFDNADNIDMWIDKLGSEQESGRLIDYLPRSKQGCIVFTTRDRKTAVKLAHQNIVEVPEMNEAGAIQLLQNYLFNQDLVNNKQDTKALLKQLTYLPLAIVQAAAYINENGIALAEYLLLLEDQEEEVIDLLSEEFEDDGRYRNVNNPVATTWLISFEQIRHRDPLAAEFLSFMACISPKDIPQSLLLPGPSRKREADALGMLDAYSFIIRRSADLALDIHRLVHLTTRSWLRKEKVLAQWTERAIARLDDVFPDNNHQNRRIWASYLVHARYALESNLVDKDGERRIDLAWKFGMCLFSDGRFTEAEVSIAYVMETRKKILGKEHPLTLTSMNSLASLLERQGKYDEAGPICWQTLQLREKVLGKEHPDTLESMNNLASLLESQGKYDEAKPIYQQTLQLREKVLGKEHSDTLGSMSNLALLLQNQGKYDEAEPICRQTLQLREKVLGKEHPNTLTSMNNLALLLQSQGKYDEAEPICWQTLQLREKVLGKEHPDTLVSMNNLALLLKSQGKFDKAEPIYRQTLQLREQVLGKEHPNTLTSINNLALLLESQGKYGEAEPICRQALQLREQILGKEHPNTLTSMNNLALLLESQGKYDKAEPIYWQTLQLREKVLGKEHPNTLLSMNNLALLLESQGKYDEAEPIYRQTLQLREKVLGKKHPNTLGSMNNLVGLLKRQGKYDEAELIYQQTLQFRE
jgi:tetratricopeptide (TPR) repeat protein